MKGSERYNKLNLKKDLNFKKPSKSSSPSIQKILLNFIQQNMKMSSSIKYDARLSIFYEFIRIMNLQSWSKVKLIQKLLVNTTDCPQYNRIIPILFNSDLNRWLVFKILIQRLNPKSLKPVDRSYNFYLSVLLLIVDVFDYQSYFSIDIVIRTDIFIDLCHFSESLSDVHATLRNDILVFIIRFAS